jgi:hypothetical protein
MILGPDGKPVMGAQVVGAPKLTDFEPLKPEQMPEVIAPLEQALAAGVPPSAPTEVPLGTLCLITSSLLFYMKKAEEPTSNGEE